MKLGSVAAGKSAVRLSGQPFWTRKRFGPSPLSLSARQPHRSSITSMTAGSNSPGNSSDAGVFANSTDMLASAAGQPSAATVPSHTSAVGGTQQPTPGAATATAKPQWQQDSKALQRQSNKTIYLIRHGEGWHNIGYEHNLDPHLTPRGWSQTAALQAHLAALQPQLNIELVVVSPLRRTLETAAGVFGASAPPTIAPAAAAVAAAAAGSANWVFMQEQHAKPLEVTRRAVVYLPAVTAAAAAAGGGTGVGQQQAPLPLLAHEGCRERIGPNVCDKFRDIHLQAADFPGVDFSLMHHDQDVAWQRLHGAAAGDGGCYLTGEEESATEARALAFYRWLMSRPESHIAVVSHCGFLVHGLRALGKGMLKTWSNAMLQQCSSSSSMMQGNAAAIAGAAGSGGAASTAGTAGSGEVAASAERAEQLRAAAGAVAGRMSVDWANCEMRSIELGWGPELLHAGDCDGDAAPAGVGDWLWASPGTAAQWFPGGWSWGYS